MQTKQNIKTFIGNFLKGLGIGAANVIPGVSSGTVALITGVFERFVHSVKSLNFKALKLLFHANFREFTEYTDIFFLLTISAGIIVSIFTFAELFGFLFEHFPLYIWSYFFGLILASVFYVGRAIEKWNLTTILSFIIGTAAAIFIALLHPASENSSYYYLILCGFVGAVSMMIPGISGSFVLILMGNYELVMVKSVNSLNFHVLIPFIIGGIIGFPAFSHGLSLIFKKFKEQTFSSLTGFILGSLVLLWPWKNPIYLTDNHGVEILRSTGEPIIQSYLRYFPHHLNIQFLLAFAIILIGMLSVWGIEFITKQTKQEEKPNTDSV
jgi:putative membrane protein